MSPRKRKRSRSPPWSGNRGRHTHFPFRASSRSRSSGRHSHSPITSHKSLFIEAREDRAMTQDSSSRRSDSYHPNTPDPAAHETGRPSVPELNPPVQGSSGTMSPLQGDLPDQSSRDHSTQTIVEPANKSMDRRETLAETHNADEQQLPSIILEQVLLQIPSLVGLDLKRLNAKRVLEKFTVEYKKSTPQHEKYPAIEESLRKNKEAAEKEFRLQCESYKQVEGPFEKTIKEFSKYFASQVTDAKSDAETQKKTQNQLDGLEKRYEDLAKDMKDLLKSNHELREDNAKIKHDNGIFKAEVAALKAQNDLLQNEQAKLLSKVQEIEGEYGKGYQTQIKELSDGLHAIQSFTSQMDAQFAQFRKTIPPDLVQTLASHSKNIQQLDDVKASIQATNTKFTAFKNEHEDFRASLGLLAGVERASKSAESAIEDLKHKLEKLGESSLSCEHPAVIGIKTELTSLRENQEKCLAIGTEFAQRSVLKNDALDKSISSELLSGTVERVTAIERSLATAFERARTLENDQAASFDEIAKWQIDLSNRVHGLKDVHYPLECEMKVLEQKLTSFERASSNSNTTDKVLSELPAKFQLLEETVKKEATEAKDALIKARTAAESIVADPSSAQNVEVRLQQRFTEVDKLYQALNRALEAHGTSISHLDQRINNINTTDLARHMLSQIEDMYPGLRSTQNSLTHFTNMLDKQRIQLEGISNNVQGLKNQIERLSLADVEHKEAARTIIQDGIDWNERIGSLEQIVSLGKEHIGSLEQIFNGQKERVDSLERLVDEQNARLQNTPDRKEIDKLASDILATTNLANDTAKQASSLVKVSATQRENDQKETTSVLSILAIRYDTLEEIVEKLKTDISLLSPVIKVPSSGRGSYTASPIIIPDAEKRPDSSNTGDQRRESREPSSIRHNDSNTSKRKLASTNGSGTSNYPSNPTVKKLKTKMFPFGKTFIQDDDDDENFVAPSPTMDDNGEE
ncbi:hypothetical protein B7494_g7370 [Chlorociboria aeruginascens]|nr:hypothetical protein B7494_g7370 [Chlorociboria aeruginascens]